MRTLARWLLRVVLALVLAAVVVGVWKREEVMRLWTVNTLFDETRIVGNFSNMGSAFISTPVSRGTGPVSPLPEGAPMQLPDGIESWINDRAVTSLLVMKDGEIRHEEYYLGTNPDDRRISWSIAKSYLSALMGVVVGEGAITSLDDPVTKYAPTLVGSGYDGASIRNALQMASGVIFNEDHTKPNSDTMRMGRVVALGGELDNFTASFTERFAEPGELWKYVSIDTHVIGMVIRGATGQSISTLLSEKIIQPLGQEQDGYYITDGAGTAFVLGGLNLTTRDFARFGQMILQNGRYGSQQVVPAAWVAESTAPSAPTEPGKIGYGYQWWIPVGAAPGEFLGRGVHGQYLYIDQNKGVVIVVTGADRNFRDTGVHASNVAMMRALASSF